MSAVPSLLLQQPAFTPINPEQLASLLIVEKLAPHLAVCFDQDNDDVISRVTSAVWYALKEAALTYDQPRKPQSHPRQRELFAVYDAVWLMMQAVDKLSQVPQPKRREPKAVTTEREVWSVRVLHHHEALKQLLQQQKAPRP